MHNFEQFKCYSSLYFELFYFDTEWSSDKSANNDCHNAISLAKSAISLLSTRNPPNISLFTKILKGNIEKFIFKRSNFIAQVQRVKFELELEKFKSAVDCNNETSEVDWEADSDETNPEPIYDVCDICCQEYCHCARNFRSMTARATSFGYISRAINYITADDTEMNTEITNININSKPIEMKTDDVDPNSTPKEDNENDNSTTANENDSSIMTSTITRTRGTDWIDSNSDDNDDNDSSDEDTNNNCFYRWLEMPLFDPKSIIVQLDYYDACLVWRDVTKQEKTKGNVNRQATKIEKIQNRLKLLNQNIEQWFENGTKDGCLSVNFSIKNYFILHRYFDNKKMDRIDFPRNLFLQYLSIQLDFQVELLKLLPNEQVEMLHAEIAKTCESILVIDPQNTFVKATRSELNPPSNAKANKNANSNSNNTHTSKIEIENETKDESNPSQSVIVNYITMEEHLIHGSHDSTNKSNDNFGARIRISNQQCHPLRKARSCAFDSKNGVLYSVGGYIEKEKNSAKAKKRVKNVCELLNHHQSVTTNYYLSNDIHCIDMNSKMESIILKNNDKFRPRYNHSCVILNEILFIIGGQFEFIVDQILNYLLFFNDKTKNKNDLFGDQILKYKKIMQTPFEIDDNIDGKSIRDDRLIVAFNLKNHKIFIPLNVKYANSRKTNPFPFCSSNLIGHMSIVVGEDVFIFTRNRYFGFSMAKEDISSDCDPIVLKWYDIEGQVDSNLEKHDYFVSSNVSYIKQRNEIVFLRINSKMEILVNFLTISFETRKGKDSAIQREYVTIKQSIKVINNSWQSKYKHFQSLAPIESFFTNYKSNWKQIVNNLFNIKKSKYFDNIRSVILDAISDDISKLYILFSTDDRAIVSPPIAFYATDLKRQVKSKPRYDLLVLENNSEYQWHCNINTQSCNLIETDSPNSVSMLDTSNFMTEYLYVDLLTQTVNQVGQASLDEKNGFTVTRVISRGDLNSFLSNTNRTYNYSSDKLDVNLDLVEIANDSMRIAPHNDVKFSKLWLESEIMRDIKKQVLEKTDNDNVDYLAIYSEMRKNSSYRIKSSCMYHIVDLISNSIICHVCNAVNVNRNNKYYRCSHCQCVDYCCEKCAAWDAECGHNSICLQIDKAKGLINNKNIAQLTSIQMKQNWCYFDGYPTLLAAGANLNSTAAETFVTFWKDGTKPEGVISFLKRKYGRSIEKDICIVDNYGSIIFDFARCKHNYAFCVEGCKILYVNPRQSNLVCFLKVKCVL